MSRETISTSSSWTAKCSGVEIGTASDQLGGYRSVAHQDRRSELGVDINVARRQRSLHLDYDVIMMRL